VAAMAVAVALAVVATASCGGPTPSPTAPPAVVPTVAAAPTAPTIAATSAAAPKPAGATPTPAATANANDVEAAFLSNVDDLIADATDLAVTPCDDLVAHARQNPNLVSSIHGFAATLKRASTNQSALDTDNVKAAIADLDQTMNQLDGALTACGIPTQPAP
jgi:hypothetical protein